jgi:Fe-S-cluster formation regulator IscX/YfhJ
MKWTDALPIAQSLADHHPEVDRTPCASPTCTAG